MAYIASLKLTRMNAITTAAGATAVLELLDANSVVLVRYTLSNPIAQAATGDGVLTFGGFPRTSAALETGTASSARIRTSVGGSIVASGITVGTTLVYDITLSTTSISATQNVTLSAGATITHTLTTELALPALASGANLSGMEFTGSASNPLVRKGASTAPNINQTFARSSDIAYLASCGFTMTRLCLSWELLQPILFDTNAATSVRAAYNSSGETYSTGAFHATYRNYITAILDAHAAIGSKCLLDLHNYCRYVDFIYAADGTVSGLVVPSSNSGVMPYVPYASNPNHLMRIFSKASSGVTLTQSHFTDFWSRAATYWGNWQGSGAPHPGLGGYGLMNEPMDLPAVGKSWRGQDGDFSQDYTIWTTYAAAAVAAIRSIDTVTPIYVGGNEWSSAFLWDTVNVAFPLTGSSATNLVYEAHQYLDYPGSGAAFDWQNELADAQAAGVVSGLPGGSFTNWGLSRLTPFVNWCSQHNVKGCVGEIGMPLDARSDSAHDSWATSFYNAANYLRANNIQVFTWAGGNHWTTHGWPVNHVAQWHQNKTLEPEVGGVLKHACGIEKAQLFSWGPGYWISGGALTFTVEARGYISSNITLTVSSNNGGTIVGGSITLAAGHNPRATFTFTPGGTNRVTTLSYAIVSGGLLNMTAPFPHLVWSYTDAQITTLAASDLASGAKSLLAKYSTSKWVMADAWTDYMVGAPCTVAGSSVRAVADSGYGSSYRNPMDMKNWWNTFAGPSYLTTPTFGIDDGGHAYAQWPKSETSLLWCKKIIPDVAGANTINNPVAKMPFELATPHFAIVVLDLMTGGGTYGPVFQASLAEEAYKSELRLDGSVPRVIVGGSIVTSADAPLTGIHVLTLASKTGAGGQRLRVDSAAKGTPGSETLAVNLKFSQMLIGGGYSSYYPEGVVTSGLATGGVKIYAAFVGVGDPSTSELAILERYASSLAGGPL